MDNFKIHATGGMLDTTLEQILSVVLEHSAPIRAWSTHEGGLVLWWSISEAADGAAPFPASFKKERVAELADTVRSWLNDQKYPSPPGIDGSSSKGWEIENDGWGKTPLAWGSAVIIRPNWCLHGK